MNLGVILPDLAMSFGKGAIRVIVKHGGAGLICRAGDNKDEAKT